MNAVEVVYCYHWPQFTKVDLRWIKFINRIVQLISTFSPSHRTMFTKLNISRFQFHCVFAIQWPKVYTKILLRAQAKPIDSKSLHQMRYMSPPSHHSSRFSGNLQGTMKMHGFARKWTKVGKYLTRILILILYLIENN